MAGRGDGQFPDQPLPWRHVPASSAQYHNVAFAGVSLTPNSMMNSEDEAPPQNVIRLRIPRVETPRRIIDASIAAVAATEQRSASVTSKRVVRSDAGWGRKVLASPVTKLPRSWTSGGKTRQRPAAAEPSGCQRTHAGRDTRTHRSFCLAVAGLVTCHQG